MFLEASTFYSGSEQTPHMNLWSCVMLGSAAWRSMGFSNKLGGSLFLFCISFLIATTYCMLCVYLVRSHKLSVRLDEDEREGGGRDDGRI